MNLKNLKCNLIFSLFIITLFACQTIQKENHVEKREKEIFDTQKSLVVSFLNKGLPHLALKELRILVKKHPNEPDFLNLMGLTQLSLNNSEMAVKFFKRSYKAKESIPVALNLSSAYINMKLYNKAIKLLKNTQETELYSNYNYPERVNHNIALAYEKNRKTKLAIKYYKTALKFNPVYYLSLMRVADLYKRQGNIKVSMKYYYKAKTSCSVCYDPIKSISQNYIALGQAQKAVPIVKTFLKNKEVSPLNRSKGTKLLRYTQKNVRLKAKYKKKKNS